MKLGELLDLEILNSDCGIEVQENQGRVATFENLYMMISMLENSAVLAAPVKEIEPCSGNYSLIIKLDWMA